MVKKLIYGLGVASIACFHVWAAYFFNQNAGNVGASATTQMTMMLPGLIPAVLMLFMKDIPDAYYKWLLSIIGGLILIVFASSPNGSDDWVAVISIFIQIPILAIFGIVGIALIIVNLNR